jgi:hypothetical protein
MKDSYRYVIHAYEDARQKRPIKHEHGGLPSSQTALRRSGGPKCSPKSSPMGGSTSTSSTKGRRRSRQDYAPRSRTLRHAAPPFHYSP